MSSNPIITSSKKFYDSIAPDYNNLLSSGKDTQVREAVQAIFTSKVNNGTVLDFGGGTGLDLPWLLKKYDEIFFIEPSDQMRIVAQHATPENNKIHFITSNLEFHNWSENHLPFYKKADGILSNFAVFNCIKDLPLLFEKMALICNPGGYLVITVLDTRWKSVLKRYPLSLTISFLLGKRKIVYNRFKKISHETYLHSVRELQNDALPHFRWLDYAPVSHSPFSIVTLQKT